MQSSFVDDFFVLGKQKKNQENMKKKYQRNLLKSLDLKQRIYQFDEKNEVKYFNENKYLKDVQEDTYKGKNAYSNLSCYQDSYKSNKDIQLLKRKKENSILDSYLSSNLYKLQKQEQKTKAQYQKKQKEYQRVQKQPRKMQKQNNKAYRTLGNEQQCQQGQESLIHNLNKKFRRLIDVNQKNNSKDSSIKTKIHSKQDNNEVQNVKKQLKNLQKRSKEKKKFEKQEIIRIHKIKSTQNIIEVMQREQRKSKIQQDQLHNDYNQNRLARQSKVQTAFNRFCDDKLKKYQKIQNQDILQNKRIKQKIRVEKLNQKQENYPFSKFWSYYCNLQYQFTQIMNFKLKHQNDLGNKQSKQKKIKDKMKITSTKIIGRVINRQIKQINQQLFYKLFKYELFTKQK